MTVRELISLLAKQPLDAPIYTSQDFLDDSRFIDLVAINPDGEVILYSFC